MMDKIFRSYLKTLETQEHLLYEQAPEHQSTIEEVKKFYQSIVKFDENGDIISEEKIPLIDVPEEAISFLLNFVHKKVDGGWLKMQFKKSRHWRNLKNVDFKPVFFDLFDFNDSKEIDKFNVSCFSVKDIVSAREAFISNAGHTFGFYGRHENMEVDVLCINSNAVDIHKVMHHEISHLVQELGGIRLVDGIKPEDVKNEDILKQNFGSSYEQVIEYFSSKEFIPHVDDIVSDLKKLRNTYYSSLTGIEFRRKVLNFLNAKTLEEAESNELYQKLWQMNRGEVSSLMMLLFAKTIGYKFQKILDWLQQEAFI